MRDAVAESDRTEQATRHQTVKRWQVKHDQIEKRIEAMYMDKLDGRIPQELFDRHSTDCRREQQAILNKIQGIQSSASAPVEEAIDLMGLMSRAAELFLEQPAAEQRRLLQVIGKSRLAERKAADSPIRTI